MKKVIEILKLMRVKHYLKNGLIILPLFFSNSFTDTKLVLNVIIGYILFSFASSVVYIFNDIRDIENDRNHPVKKNRPLASKTISIPFAIGLLLTLIILLLLIQFMYFGPNNSLLFIIGYILINIIYSILLKKIALIDIVTVAIGFLIRVYYGAHIINVRVSDWLFLTILFVAFYMALGKRRNELIKLQNSSSREVLKYYTKEFLDKNMYMCLGSAIVFYSLWCVDLSNINNSLIWTVPIVTIILMRYNLIIEKDSHGDPVDVLLSDMTILILSIIYVVMIVFIIYFGGLKWI